MQKLFLTHEMIDDEGFGKPLFFGAADQLNILPVVNS